ncbi:hypothetical protein LIER_05864 [Lithospermum erythrorhizon]|uniref:Uncharacterized protein n=1 Tax=Lithospermum erythrorhizon TaxID=34254 RepID=A0AAV3P2B9_LITER
MAGYEDAPPAPPPEGGGHPAPPVLALIKPFIPCTLNPTKVFSIPPPPNPHATSHNITIPPNHDLDQENAMHLTVLPCNP